METKNIEKKDGKLTFDVLVDAQAFEAAVNKAFLRSRSRISVPGFRRGKAPRKMIESMYGKDVFHDDAVNSLALDAYKFGVEESGSKTVGDPALTDYKVGEDGALTVSYEAALYPEAVLGQYKGLTAYKPAVEVSEAEVDAEIDKVRQRNARIVTVERGAALGDTVIIDFDGFRDGKRFSGGKGQNYSLKLGSGSFVPGFEDQLVGAAAGEDREVNVTFPENYAEELAGADAMFKVKVHEVQETQLPELDDEFAKDVSEFDTLAEYRDSVRGELTEDKHKRTDNEFKAVLLRKAADNATADIPEAMIRERLNNHMDELERRCTAQGMTVAQYLSMMGMNEQLYRTYMRPGITYEIRTELMLEQVVKAENITVEDEAVAEEYKRLADSYGMELDRVKEILPEDVVRHDLEVQKASDLIVAEAVATDKPETPAPVAEPEAEAQPEPAAESEAEAQPEPAAEPEEEKAPEAPPKKKRTRKTKTEAPAEE